MRHGRRAPQELQRQVDAERGIVTEAWSPLGRAGEVMREQGRTRDAFALMLGDLKSTLENARREASLTSELVSRLEAAGAALAQAEGEARDYLEGINRVLAEVHGSFAENVERTLRQGNSQFHKELSTAVDYLKGAIEELGDTLENLVVRK